MGLSRGVRDDVDEHVAHLAWDDPCWQPSGRLSRDTDELRFGVHGAMRSGAEVSTGPSALDPAVCGGQDGRDVACRASGSRAWLADGWYRVRYGPFYSEADGIRCGGTTLGGLPFPDANRRRAVHASGGVMWLGLVSGDPDFDPIRQLTGMELFERDLWELEIEASHASGDRDRGRGAIQQRPPHPDFNVCLMLSRRSCASSTRARTARPTIRWSALRG